MGRRVGRPREGVIRMEGPAVEEYGQNIPPEHRPARRSGVRGPALVVVVVLVFVAIFLLGAGFGATSTFRDSLRSILPSSMAASLLGSQDLFPLQSEVLDRVESSFYKPFDAAALEGGAISGMLGGLEDPYTSYFDPTAYAGFQEHTDGRYSGVGMVVEMNGSFVQVVTAFKGSPAEQAGVRPGDIVLGVDKEPTDGLSLEQVVAKIKGATGTSVTLELYHMPPGTTSSADRIDGGLKDLPAGGESAELTMERKAIDVPVVETEIKDAGGKKAAYITFSTFSEGSAKKLKQAVETALVKDGATVIVLDLRNNGGGLLLEAVDLASIFIPSGVIVTTQGLHSPKQVFEATGGAIPGEVPVYLLVNSFSASASEIVAGALKDTGRATLVGETTFGKGLVQSVEGLSNGGALKVTTAVYLTPNGTDINKKGVSPDVELKVDSTAQGDPVLDKALELAAQGV
jgi:carboxyl-terminal processing protease